MVWLSKGEKFDDTFSRFDRIRTCDRRTDGHLATVESALCVASRGKIQYLSTAEVQVQVQVQQVCRMSTTLCAERMLIESTLVSPVSTLTRSLPQVPRTDRRSSCVDDISIYEDIDFVDGCGRGDGMTVDDPYHYVDIDRLADQCGRGHQIVSPYGYEGLDQAALPLLRQPQMISDNYERLGAGEAADAGTAGAATEDVEMTGFDADNKVMRSMTYLPRRARVPHLPNKFRHHVKIGYESSETWQPARTPLPPPHPSHPSRYIKGVEI